MPKNSTEVLFKPFFSVKMGHFLPFYEVSCVQMPASFFRKELRFSGDDPRFLTCIHGQMPWVRKSQLFTKKSYGQNATQGKKIIKR